MDDQVFNALVGWVQRTYVDFKPDWQDDPAVGRVGLYESAPEWAQSDITPEQGRAVILEFFIAESSKDKYAWDALKLIAEQHLRDREPLPDALADWLADWLAGKIQRPPGLLN